MIVFLTVLYVALLYILIKVKVLPSKTWVWLTVILYDLILLIAFFIPMQWGSPAGDLRLMNRSVTITPNVSGVVVDVPVKANTPLKKGDVLFRIDPTVYQARYDMTKADLKLAELRLSQATKLAKKQAGSVYNVQKLQASVEKLKAKLADDKWKLDETVVRAPSDGYVTYVGLRPGQRVVTMPLNRVMAFIDTSEVILGSQVFQNFTRYIEPGQDAEVTFKARPGKVYAAKVMYMLPITAQGQFLNTGMAASALSSTAGPFFVRLKMDKKDENVTKGLVAGSLGSAAIYTGHVKPASIIRKVMIRLTAIMNYINPA